jgi:hypothetical protein
MLNGFGARRIAVILPWREARMCVTIAPLPQGTPRVGGKAPRLSSSPLARLYCRSAPLHNTPPVPRGATQRTTLSRAIARAAWRRTRAVLPSSALPRSRRAMVMTSTTPPSRAVCMCSIALCLNKALPVVLGWASPPSLESAASVLVHRLLYAPTGLDASRAACTRQGGPLRLAP